MRVVFNRILVAAVPALLVLGAVGLTSSPAHAGAFTQPQCANQADIIQYYGLNSDFSGLGLKTGQCKSLCKKNGSACKSFVNQAKSCNNKSINDLVSTSQKSFCSTLSGSEKKDCNQAYKNLGKDLKDSNKSDSDTAKDDCNAIKDDCLAACEAPQA